MKTPIKANELASAVAYLGAVEVAPGRYAVQQGPRYIIVPVNILETLTWLAPNGKVFESDTGAIPRALKAGTIITMPTWWTPNHRSTFRCGCGQSPQDVKTNFALHAHCLGKAFERITVNLETGEEEVVS